MDSLDRDKVNAVFSGLQAKFAETNALKEGQRLRDLRTEVAARKRRIEELELEIADAREAAGLVERTHPGLAMAFVYYAEILDAERKALNPASMEHKIMELERNLSWSRMVEAAMEDFRSVL